MKTSDKNSILFKTSSVWLALLCLIVFTILLAVVDSLVRSFDEGGATAYSLFGLLSATACFFLIKRNPKSVWYVPLIINSLEIVAAFTEQFFWKLPPNASGIPTWIPVCGGWVLTLIFSIMGVKKGKKVADFDNPKTS